MEHLEFLEIARKGNSEELQKLPIIAEWTFLYALLLNEECSDELILAYLKELKESAHYDWHKRSVFSALSHRWCDVTSSSVVKEILDLLYEMDKGYFQFFGFAFNQNISKDLLKKIAVDCSVSLASQLFERCDLDDDLHWLLALHFSSKVRNQLLTTCDVSLEIIEILTRDDCFDKKFVRENGHKINSSYLEILDSYGYLSIEDE